MMRVATLHAIEGKLLEFLNADLEGWWVAVKVESGGVWFIVVCESCA